MTQVNFIVAEDRCRLERKLMLCALAAARWAKAQDLLVQAASAQELEELDALLWSYNDISFLPHARLGSTLATSTPIQLTWDIPPAGAVNCLVNLAASIPAYAAQCGRIYELVDHDPQHKDWARHRYQQYKKADFALDTQRIRAYTDLAAG